MATERIQRRIEILLDEADEAVAQSDWPAVRDRAQNVLRLDPENKDALAVQAGDIESLGIRCSAPPQKRHGVDFWDA